MIELEILQYIKQTYGRMLSVAAVQYRHRSEVLAGIMMRETEGGLSSLLDVPGPAGRGDNGHGHGLFQIDDRWFQTFCQSAAWKDPGANISFGAGVLAGKRKYLVTACLGLKLTDEDLEQASIAAYNCGEGKEVKAIRAGLGFDYYTTHGNYSKEVLRFAAAYAVLEESNG